MKGTKTWTKQEILAVAPHPGVVVAHVPCNAIQTARPSPQQGRPGYVKFILPDEIIKSIRGDEDKRPVFAIVIVPSTVRAEAESPIIKPGIIVK